MNEWLRETIRAGIIFGLCYYALWPSIELAVLVAFALAVANEATVKGFR